MGEIKIQVTPNKPQSLQVGTRNVKNSVEVEQNPTHYYSTLAKQWAVKMDGMVQDEDYSSKYWATQSKNSAEIAEASIETNTNLTEILSQNYQTYLNNLTDEHTQALTDITTKKDESLNAIETTTTEKITELNNISDTAIDDITNAKTEAVEIIDNVKNVSIEEVEQEGTKQVDNIKQTGFYMKDGKLYYIDEDGNEVEYTGGGTGGASRNIGETVFSLLPLEDAGLHLLDGTLIQGLGSYRAFVQYIAALYDSGETHPSYFVTEEEWQQSVTNYGVCGKFVYDSTANTVRLPKVTGIVEGTLDVNALGDIINAGLPDLQLTSSQAGDHTHTRGTMNITGTIDFRHQYTESDFMVATSGAFSASNVSGNYQAINAQWVNSNTGMRRATFRASNAWTGATSSNGNHTHAINVGNPLVGNSNTVQPQTVKGFLYIVIANAAKTEIEVDIDNVMTDLNGKMDKDYSNATITPMLQNQITNCITEIPQKVKCNVAGNTLTTLSNSIAILPYGTEDKTADYPIGSTFVTEDFTVYDTQYIDGKFFIWLKTQDNKTASINSNPAALCAAFEMNTGYASWNLVIKCYSGDTAPASPIINGTWWYDTTNNIIKRYTTTWENYYITLPHAIFNTDGTTLSLLETFNGIGFIGSTIWVDKGVKGLMTNEKNPDGTFNSIPYEATQLLIYDQSNNFPPNTQREIILKNDGTFARTFEYVVKENGYLAQSDNLDNNLTALSLGTIQTNDTSIISMNSKQAFQAADVQDIDGKWVIYDKYILQNITLNPNAPYSIDVSNILPKDNNIYEVVLTVIGYRPNQTGTNNIYAAGGENKVIVTRCNSGTTWGGFISVLVDSNRVVKITNSGTIQATEVYIDLERYRKVR